MPQFFKKPTNFDWLYSKFDYRDHINESSSEDDWVLVEFLDGVLDEVECGDVDMNDQEDIESVYSFLHANKPKIKYTILSKADLRQRLEDNISKVCEVLLLTRNEAAILLRHFKWVLNDACDEWLASEESVRQAVGLLLMPVVETPADATEGTCTLCHADFSKNVMHSASCGHQICIFCWEGCISEAISNGPQCLALRCPEASCNAAVGPYLMEQLVSEEDKKKLEDHLLGSYLLGSKKQVKWCPSSSCAVLSYADLEKVTCHCFETFCWKCSLEGHTPVDCATANVWMTEGDRKSEDWVNANATKCPYCNYLYEKGETRFFNVVHCAICKFSFCSVCGEKVATECMAHTCIVDTESQHYEAKIKKSLERYNRSYEAWATCESSRVNALENLKQIKEFQQNVHSDPFGEVGFVVEAIQQVIECWRFLKWTHVYGYLVLPDDQTAKKNFIEFSQEYAIGLVKRLQEHVDEYQKIQNFLYEDAQPLDHLQFPYKLIKQTSLEEGLSDALSEVVSIPELTGKPEVSQGENSYSLKSGVASLSCSLGHKITIHETERSSRLLN